MSSVRPMTLTYVWLLLVGMTLLAMLTGIPSIEAPTQGMSWWAVLLVLGATLGKVYLILMFYLDLRTSTPAWRGLFVSLILVTLSLVGAAFVFG